MARPRKPTALLELHNAFAKHPERKAARANEPQPVGPLGNPPRHFSKDEKRIWKELAGIVAAGVLTISDRWAVEVAVKLMTKFRGNTASTPELTLLTGLLGRMGLNPADRSRITTVPQPKEAAEDSWASFAQEPTGQDE